MKSTQLAYPTVQQLVQQGICPSPPPKLAKLALAEQQSSEKVHHLRDGAVVLYKRKESSVWQVRFRLFERKDWLSFSTKQRDLTYAKRVAGDMYDRARFKEELGIPQSVKRFSTAADACMKQLDREIEQGLKPRTNMDYKRVIRLYFIPFFGKYNLTSINSALVREFEVWRNEKIGRMPMASTLMTHASAYNRVIETAIENVWVAMLPSEYGLVWLCADCQNHSFSCS